LKGIISFFDILVTVNLSFPISYLNIGLRDEMLEGQAEQVEVYFDGAAQAILK
jgi:hypothetical protein